MEITVLSPDVINQLKVFFEPLYFSVCFLVMLGIAILGVILWKR